MKVRILEKYYHHTYSPSISTLFRRQQELWIREQSSAFPYECNDNVKSVGNLSSPQCNNVHLMGRFNNTKTRSIVMDIGLITNQLGMMFPLNHYYIM